MSKILNRYIAQYFLQWVGIVVLAMIGLAVMGGFVENLKLMQKIGGSTPQALLLTIYGVPQLVPSLAPFIFLFASLIAFMRLNESQAIAVLRSAGQSVWQFAFPALLTTLILAIITITLIDPLAARSAHLRDQLENQILGRDDQLNILSTGVWIRLRQESGHYLIRGQFVSDPTTLQLKGVDVFHYGTDHKLHEHIIGEKAILKDNVWTIETDKGAREILSLDPLSFESLRDRLFSAHALPVWRLPSQISSGEKAGLDMTQYRLRFHTLLALPFFCVFMVLIAIAFSIPRGRLASTGRTIATAIMLGFGAYAGSQLVSKIAQLSLLPVAAAAWIPTLVLLLLSVSILIEREERG